MDNCKPMETIYGMMDSKWKPKIIWYLGNGASSLRELAEALQPQGLSPAALQTELSELKAQGFVEPCGEMQHAGMTYQLTEKQGMEMLKAVMLMESIGKQIFETQGTERER